jgi:hypothetical protein
MKLLVRALGATALCVGFYFLTRNLLGPIVWVILAPLIGVSFSRVVIDFAAAMNWEFRNAALKPYQGTYYSFQNITMNIFEDDDHCRWLPTKDLRKVLPALPSDAMLQKTYPRGFLWVHKPPQPHLRDDAVLHYLNSAQTPQGIKFKNWLDRNVVYPAVKSRNQRGIYIGLPTDVAPDD